jgi:hypothetical protein
MSTALGNSKWLLPTWLVAQGAFICTAKAIGGEPREGVGWLAAATALALVFLANNRSEVVKTLRGDEVDERMRFLDGRAIGISAAVMMGVLFVGFLVESAQGEDGLPWGPLVGGWSALYVLVLGLLNRRS